MGYGCIRVDDTTHWTTIFGALKTEYDANDVTAAETGDVVSESVKDTTCWVDLSLAINLDEGVSPDNQGVCGVDSIDVIRECVAVLLGFVVLILMELDILIG